MSARIDLTGNVYGELTVLSHVKGKKWLVRCSCGTEKEAGRDNLISGQQWNCGCKAKRPKFIDMTGEVHHQLTVLSHDGNGRWLTRCTCGTEKVIEGQALRDGRTKSCGCTSHIYEHPNRIDLTGQVFGEWTVLAKGRTEPKPGGSLAFWKCRCSCGEEREVMTGSLNRGASRSCGHIAEEKLHYNLIGEKFGMLEVKWTSSDGNRSVAHCLCACGNYKDVYPQHLLNGHTKSCGCLAREAARQRMTILRGNHDVEQDAQGKFKKWVKKQS